MDSKISIVKDLIERNQFEKDLRAQWSLEQEEKQQEMFKQMKVSVDTMLESYKSEMALRIKDLKNANIKEKEDLADQVELKQA
jgi:hypothetical protein